MNFLAELSPEPSLFRDASPALTQTMNRVAEPVRLAKGAVLFREGDAPDGLFQITSGQIEISVSSTDGRRVVLNVLKQGDVLGEIALFDQGPRTATAEVIADCALLKISRNAFFGALEDVPGLAIEMITLAGKRMRTLSDLHHESLFLALETRMARRLLAMVSDSNEGPGHVRLTHSALAEHLNVSRELVSRTLAKWRAAGLVDVGHGWLKLMDIARLKQLALDHPAR